jgi:N-acetyl-anhydromuramyl-L-alanine amidase AmpD
MAPAPDQQPSAVVPPAAAPTSPLPAASARWFAERRLWFAASGLLILTLLLCILLPLACSHRRPRTIRPGDALSRSGDEIVICGQFFHTTAPVVLWMDSGGYDAYRLEARFTEPATRPATVRSRPRALSAGYDLRDASLTPEQQALVRGGGWPLALLQDKVDQFVIHYDVAGTSRQCFKALHDGRNLSVHFMLDVDGTIYQTLDLKERAWHAGPANTRSIGIEIANIGAYRPDDPKSPLDEWYPRDEAGHRRIVFPAWLKEPGIRTPDFIPRPARDEAVLGAIHGHMLRQYDYTPQQYDSLIKLTATLCSALPRLKCDYPRDAKGQLITGKLPEQQLEAYQGLLGHYHITTNKIDPGPAFQWDLVVNGARRLMSGKE